MPRTPMTCCAPNRSCPGEKPSWKPPKPGSSTWSKTAALSSITLELRPAITSQPVTDNVWSPIATLHNAVSALLATLRGVVDFLIFFVVSTLPWLVVIGLLVYVLVRLILSRVKKKGNDAR